MLMGVTFLRYQNRDSTVELVCTRCLQIVGRRIRSSELVEAEKTHVCDPWEFDDQYSESQRGPF